LEDNKLFTFLFSERHVFDAGKKRRPGGIRFGSKELHRFDPVVVQVAHVNSIGVPVEDETLVSNRGAFFKALDALRKAASLEAALGRGAARDGCDFAAANFLLAGFPKLNRDVAGSID
jgi:hypothetical protein